jgi:hypothetical protein
MAMDVLKNFAYTGVLIAPEPPSFGTSLTVYNGESARFPAPPFSVSVWPIGLAATPANAEILRVTAIAGDVWTIQRQQEGTQARAIEANDQIAQAMTVDTINDLIADLKAYTDSKITQMWPVGSIFTTIGPTNPASLIGYGTWVSFGAGRCLFGLDGSAEFASAEQQGGAKTHVHAVWTGNAGSHSHSISADGYHDHAVPSAGPFNLGAQGNSSSQLTLDGTTHELYYRSLLATNYWRKTDANLHTGPAATGISAPAHTHPNVTAGGSHSHGAATGAVGDHAHAAAMDTQSSLSPYVVVYFWKRTG